MSGLSGKSAVRFASVFATEMNEYLSIREKVLQPQSMRVDRIVLTDFDKCAALLGVSEKRVTEELVNRFISCLREKNHSRTVSDRVSNLRGFLEYMRYSGADVFIPRCPKWSEDYVPYIFSDDEMSKIFAAADEKAVKARENAFGNLALPMILRLLYGCGLRLGEALRLVVGDVDWGRGTLMIRVAKNKKQRLVPMRESLSEMLRAYCAALGIIDKPAAFLFPGEKADTHITFGHVNYNFKLILKRTGIFIPAEKPGKRGQCLHCLRHKFAVKSFAAAEANGRPTADSVPYLSVYLGHFDMDGTEKYLKFSSDIFPEHTEMFANYAAGAFSTLGGDCL